jgi:hypothetical protein
LQIRRRLHHGTKATAECSASVRRRSAPGTPACVGTSMETLKSVRFEHENIHESGYVQSIQELASEGVPAMLVLRDARKAIHIVLA